MKPGFSGWILFCALALSAMVAERAWPAPTLDGKLTYTSTASSNVPSPASIAVYVPPGYDASRKQPYPLLIQLHGGLGTDKKMDMMSVWLEEAIEKGLVPPMVSVMPSAGRSFYMNYRDGSQKWETFITTELLSYMRTHYNVVKGREGTFITGISMGGMGSLRIAFKHPGLFQAVASQEPGIEPALSYDDIKLRDRFWRTDKLYEKIYGNPVDKNWWATNNPANIAKVDPARLLGLGIYLEVGDQDMFYLDQGSEFLHRILFDAGISHEYRLVKGADHAGASLQPRFLDAMAFIGRQISPPDWIDKQAQSTRKLLNKMKIRAGYPVTPFDPDRIHAK